MSDNKEFAEKLRKNLQEKKVEYSSIKQQKTSSTGVIILLLITSIFLASFCGFLLYSFINPSSTKVQINSSSNLSLLPISSKEAVNSSSQEQSVNPCNGPTFYTNPALPTSFKVTIPCEWQIEQDLKPASYYLQSQWLRSFAFSVTKGNSSLVYSYRNKVEGAVQPAMVNQVFNLVTVSSINNKDIRKLGPNVVVNTDGFTFAAPAKNFVFKQDQPEEWAKLYDRCIQEIAPTPPKVECKNADTTVFGNSVSNWNQYNTSANNFMIFYTGEQNREADEIIKNTLF